MRLHRAALAFYALSLLVLGTVSTRAQGTSAVTFPTPPPDNVSTPISRFNIGFDFTVSTPLQVTGLSFYDYGADGLAVSHAVGLWGPGPANLLLAQVIVTTDSPLLDSFRYAALTSVINLVPNVIYTVGAFTHADGQTGDPYFNRPPADVSYAANFNFVRATTSGAAQDGLVKPTVDQSLLNAGFFGPSLLLQPVVVVVPEPTTWAMICGGACTLLGLQRARRHKGGR